MNPLRIAHLEHGLEYLESQTVKTLIQRVVDTIHIVLVAVISDVPARLGLKAPALARLVGLTAFKNASRAVSPTDGSALARVGLSPGLSGRRREAMGSEARHTF